MKAGVYTAAQADRGQALFRSKCASCHAPNRFTDDLFYTSFAGKPLWEMFDVISDSMPEDNPGSLKKEEYADVIAYLLKLNNFPGRRVRPADRQGRAQRDPDGKAVACRNAIATAALHKSEHHHADRAPFRVPGERGSHRRDREFRFERDRHQHVAGTGTAPSSAPVIA